jgi:DNA-binding MarR family transcriptional regulator
VISKKRADLLGHQLAMRLRAAYAHLRRRSNVAFAPFGMTSDQYVLLMVLAQMGEATQQQLVRSCFSDTATIGTMLSLLKAKGLITRMPHPRDGRAWSVKLTGPGRHMAEEMRRASARLRTELAGLFTEKELPLLIEFLGRLAAAMPPPARRSRNTITSSTRHANS